MPLPAVNTKDLAKRKACSKQTSWTTVELGAVAVRARMRRIERGGSAWPSDHLIWMLVELLTELEKALNAQASLGYRLHTISTASSGTKGLGGGDRIQATMVFENII